MFLLEPQFSRVFVNRLLGRVNEADCRIIVEGCDSLRRSPTRKCIPCQVDDVASLDKELHKNMLQIKARSSGLPNVSRISPGRVLAKRRSSCRNAQMSRGLALRSAGSLRHKFR